MNRFTLLLAAAALYSASPAAEESQSMSDENFNQDGAHGTAIMATTLHKELAEQYHFSAAYRAGDFVYTSGVVADAPGENPATVEEFQQELRRAFNDIKGTLAAAGADFSHVVKMTSFHVDDSTRFDGDRFAHLAAFMPVKDEFLPQPWSAWTAILVQELFTGRGLVEIQVIAHVPGD